MCGRLQSFKGHRITYVDVDLKMSVKAARRFIPEDEYNAVSGQTILDVRRRGKFIVFITTSGAILAHNAMSGFWDEVDDPWTFDYVEGKRISTSSDVRLIFHLDYFGKSRVLRYHDARMFGSVHFMSPEALTEKLSALGPDAAFFPYAYDTESVLTAVYFDILCDSKKSVKEVLIDQTKIAGIGNIYVAEACWEAGVLPHRSIGSLTQVERMMLLYSIRRVMNAALDRKLDYGDLRVYRRENCPNCSGPITVEKFKGRSSHWCPTCQQ